MYPAVFDNLAPESLDEVVQILAERGDAANVMAGGHRVRGALVDAGGAE